MFILSTSVLFMIFSYEALHILLRRLASPCRWIDLRDEVVIMLHLVKSLAYFYYEHHTFLKFYRISAMFRISFS